MFRGDVKTLVRGAGDPGAAPLTPGPSSQEAEAGLQGEARSCLPSGGGRGLRVQLQSTVECLPGIHQTPGSVLRTIHTNYMF